MNSRSVHNKYGWNWTTRCIFADLQNTWRFGNCLLLTESIVCKRRKQNMVFTCLFFFRWGILVDSADGVHKPSCAFEAGTSRCINDDYWFSQANIGIRHDDAFFFILSCDCLSRICFFLGTNKKRKTNALGIGFEPMTSWLTVRRSNQLS